MMQKIYEALAAVAVFGDLYDKSKDIYDVLAGYLRLVIVSEHKADFTAAEITDRVNVANAFDINESVVKRGLKRLGIPLSKRIYHVDPEFFEGTEINDLDEQIEQNQNLLEDLFGFIRARNGEQDLSTEERNEIQSQFFEYLLNDSYSGTYSIDISNYIVAASKNAEVFSTINRIKEGTLVYEGITYSSEVDSCHTWNTELAICIEMEVLFYIAGYNGDIYKSMYEQLLDYIDEINQSRGKGRKYISLFYTYTVQDEIEGYFRKAEMIFGKGEAIDPSKKPLRFILEGVTRKQDIQLKKAKFFNLLNSRDIRPLDVDFYSLENKQYNRIDEKVYTNIISSVQTDRDDDYIKKCIDKVNEIEILRKNMNVRLHDVKYILLTANHVILRCAYADDFYQSGEVPKATDLDFLVNRFWFVLNKGFGKGVLPKTIDIVSRAKMVISFNTDAKIANLYNEMRNKYRTGGISETDVAYFLDDMRSYSRIPDEINDENIEEQIVFLNEYNVNTVLEERRREEVMQRKNADEIAELKEKVSGLELAIDIERKEKFLFEEESKRREQELRDELEQEKNERKQDLDELEGYRNEKWNKRLRWKKVLRGAFLILIVAALLVSAWLIFRFIAKLNPAACNILSVIISLGGVLVEIVGGMWKKFVTQASPKDCWDTNKRDNH